MTSGIGVRLRQARERAELTQRALAEAAGMGRQWLVDVEGGRDPRVSDVVRLYEVLASRIKDLSLGWLLTGSDGQVPGRVEAPVKRRRFLVGSAIVPATLALRMIASKPASPAIEPGLLSIWEERTANFASARTLEPPRLLLPQIEAHLMVLEQFISLHPQPGRMMRQLYSLAAGTNAIAGWVALMAGRRDDARDYLANGEALAREVGDTDALLMLLMLQADYFSAVKLGGLGGFPDAARAALEEAMTLISPETPMTLAAPVVLRLAEEHAYARHDAEALALLEQGRELTRSSRVRTHYLRRVWLERLPETFEGSILQLLGRPHEAIAVLEPIETPPPSHRPLLRADLAAAHAQQGDPSTAGVLLGEALALAANHGLMEAAERVRGVRLRYLTGFDQEPIVRQLDEQLAAIL